MMKRNDELYKYGVVIDYNTDPVVEGKRQRHLPAYLERRRHPHGRLRGCFRKRYR